eukprot:jgi/Ulvmu1/197/UM001_0201.1
MRNERAEDVREWLQYHRWIGVDHVLLHDNNEDGGLQAAEFVDFIQDGFVTHFTVDGEAQQIPVYQRCISVSGTSFSWIAAIDIDEFIVVEDTAAKAKPHANQIKAVLEDFRFQPGLWLQWRAFGPGSHHSRPGPGGPMAHYTSCMPTQWPPEKLARLKQLGMPADGVQAASITKYGKTIANRFWVSHASNAHGFMYRGNAAPVTDAQQRVPCVLHDARPECAHAQIAVTAGMDRRNHRLVIHHYATRSFDDYQAKLRRGAGDHARDSGLRGMGFFQVLNESTVEHPSCMALTSAVKECCRDGRGRPHPPPPALKRSTVAATPAITPLAAADVPNLFKLGLRRGMALDETRANPFSASYTGSSAVCALWDGQTTPEALHEWLDHHRYIGVTHVFLYTHLSNIKGETIIRYNERHHGFVKWRQFEMPPNNQTASEIVRQQCIDQGKHAHNFIIYLRVNEYLMPRGAGARQPGALRKLLQLNEFRYAPGLVAPVFQFTPTPKMVKQGGTHTPLRHYNRCAYMGHKFEVRMLASSYWVESPLGVEHFSFVEDLLAVTDTLRPWVPSIMETQPGGSRILSDAEDQVSMDMHMRQFRLDRPFGARVAVFVFPLNEEPSSERQHASLMQTAGACSDAIAAADACCSVQVSKRT